MVIQRRGFGTISRLRTTIPSVHKREPMSALPTQSQAFAALVAAGFKPIDTHDELRLSGDVILRHTQDAFILAWIPRTVSPKKRITVYRREKDYPKLSKSFMLDEIATAVFQEWISTLLESSPSTNFFDPLVQAAEEARASFRDGLGKLGQTAFRQYRVTVRGVASFEDCQVSINVKLRGSVRQVLDKIDAIQALDDPTFFAGVKDLLAKRTPPP